jgi:hypothetical protein
MIDTTTHENAPHYAWGASGAKQWRGCKGSVAFVQECKAAGKIPERADTAYSVEGTHAHELADLCLSGKILRSQIPPEFLEHLGGYLDYADELAEQMHGGATVLTEAKVPLYYNTAEFGTVDYAVITDKSIHILDLKYGVGEKVTAEGNDQLAIYAMSLIDNIVRSFSLDTPVTMAIYQPRHHSFDGTPEVWTVTLGQLFDISTQIRKSYAESKAADATMLTPSYDACRFCDARRICPARIGNMFDGLPEEINPLVGEIDKVRIANVEITDAVRVRVAMRSKEIVKFLEELNDNTLELIESGKHIAGLKTIDGGKGNRKWGSNEEEAEKLLRKIPAADKFAPKKLLSPAQIEKVLKKIGTPLEKQPKRFLTRWESLVQQSDGSPKLVLDTDPRPARITGAGNFEDEVTPCDCI